jgi:hypothetical protein
MTILKIILKNILEKTEGCIAEAREIPGIIII